MKVGIKLIRKFTSELIDGLLDVIDFFEIMALEAVDYSFLKDYGLPVVVHNKHFGRGINFADKKKEKINLESLNLSFSLADYFEAGKIIVHPGNKVDESCSLQNVIDFLNGINDSRILVENTIYWDESLVYGGESQAPYAGIGFDFKTMQEILSKTGKGFCLDFAHAAASADQLRREPLEFIKRLLKLRPQLFHVSDSIFGEYDLHLHLGQGNFPLNEFKKMLPKEAMVTIETMPDSVKSREDILFLKR